MRWLRSAFIGLLAAAVLAQLARAALLIITIEGESMAPTFEAGEAVLILRRRFSRPIRRGDVVVCRLPPHIPGPGSYLVKRVTAIAGDIIASPAGDEPGKRLPAGQVYVQGDNAVSYDSRAFGPIPIDYVRGRLLVRLTEPGAPSRLLRTRRRGS